jgi:hypothetical protein
MRSLAAAAHGTAFLVFRVHHYTHGPSQFQHAASAFGKDALLSMACDLLLWDVACLTVFWFLSVYIWAVDRNALEMVGSP